MFINKIVICVIICVEAYAQMQNDACEFTHPQNYFCDSAFAILAIPRKVSLTPFGMRYEIEIVREYRMSFRADKALYMGLYIKVCDTMNGFEMDIDEPYMITGAVYGNRAYTGECNLVMPLNLMNFYQQIGFKEFYDEGCDCAIEICHGAGSCQQTNNEDVCTVDRSMYPDCHTEFSHCVRTSDGCQWAKNNLLTKCLKKQFLNI